MEEGPATTPEKILLPLLFGLIASLVVLGIGCWLLADVVESPGDRLLLLRDAEGPGYYQPPARLLAQLCEGLSVWQIEPKMRRLWCLVTVFLGTALLGFFLTRARGFGENTSVLTLGSLGLWPWLGQDPTAVSSAGYMAIPLLLGLALPLGRILAPLSESLLFALGCLSTGLAGPHHPFGEIALLGVLWSRGCARDGNWRWIGGLISYTLGVYLFGLMVGEPSSTIPAPWSWWVDVENPSALHGVWVGQVFLLLLAIGWWVGGARFAASARLAQPLVFALSLLFAAVAATTSWIAIREHARIQDRDEGSLERTLSQLPSIGKSLFLNLPLHVRPLVAVHALGRDWDQILVAKTWDTGTNLHIPFEWNEWNVARVTPVWRWTASGFQSMTWGDCWKLPSFPLARFVAPQGRAFPSSPYRMLSFGELPEMLSGRHAQGQLPEPGDSSIEADQEGDGVRIRVRWKAQIAFAVALGAGRRQLFSNPEILRLGLGSAWFRPPYPLAAVEARIVGKDKKPLTPSAWLPGYGPIFRLYSPDELDLELVVRLASGR